MGQGRPWLNSAHIPAGSTVDPAEIERFARIAEEWWDPRGKFAPLHRLNPVRLGFIRDRAAAHWQRDPLSGTPLRGPVAARYRLRRRADLRADGPARRPGRPASTPPTATSPRPACMPPARSSRSTTARPRPRRWPTRGAQFDIVLALEIVEHVADVDLFLHSIGRLAKPGGLVFLSTLNRTAKAWALAIAGAEYVLRWLPRGTHDWRKFLKPSEVVRGLRQRRRRAAGDRRRGLQPAQPRRGRSTSATSTSTTCCTAARALAEPSTTSSIPKAAAWMAGWLACIVVMTVAGREATASAQRLPGDGAALADRHLPALSADPPRWRHPRDEDRRIRRQILRNIVHYGAQCCWLSGAHPDPAGPGHLDRVHHADLDGDPRGRLPRRAHGRLEDHRRACSGLVGVVVIVRPFGGDRQHRPADRPRGGGRLTRSRSSW